MRLPRQPRPVHAQSIAATQPEASTAKFGCPSQQKTGEAKGVKKAKRHPSSLRSRNSLTINWLQPFRQKVLLREFWM